jgi:hypothetical protein
VSDNVQTIPAITGLSAVSEAANEFVESPLSSVASMGTESKMVEIFPGENVEAEPTGVITEDRFGDLPEALKRDFLSALTSTRKLLKNGWTVPQESSKARSLGKVIIAEEHGSLVIAPLFDTPSSYVFAEATQLSDSDKEIVRNIERIFTDVAVEVPLVLVPLKSEGVWEPLESERGEPMKATEDPNSQYL